MRGVNSQVPLPAGDGTQFMLYRKVADEESRARREQPALLVAMVWEAPSSSRGY